jgi:hypothetical protein
MAARRRGGAIVHRRRDGARPYHRTQEEGRCPTVPSHVEGEWGLTGPNNVNFRGEESLCERPEAKRVYVSDRYDTVVM